MYQERMQMSKIYTDIEEFEKAQETEFREKVEELAYYQGDNERTTIDGEWTESELRDDIWTEANAILKDWIPKHINRAILDKDLTHEEFIVEDICNRFDIIEVYLINHKIYDGRYADQNEKYLSY